MPVLDAGIQARPITHAIILAPGCSKRRFGQVIEALSGQWGGIQSIILPAAEVAASPLWREFLELRDPDLVLYTAPTPDMESFIQKEVDEGRICPAAIASSWRYAITQSCVQVRHLPDTLRSDRVLVDLRLYGYYNFGQAAQYGILAPPSPAAFPSSQRVSVARYRRAILTQQYPRPQTAVERSGRRAGIGTRLRFSIIFIGDPDQLNDACAFWNLRALLGLGSVQWLDFREQHPERTLHGTPAALTAYSLWGTPQLNADYVLHLTGTLGNPSAQLRPMRDCLPHPVYSREWRPRIEAVSIEAGQIVLSRPVPPGTSPTDSSARWAVDIELRDPAGASSLLIRPPFHISTNQFLRKPGQRATLGVARASKAGTTVLVSADPADALIRVQIPNIEDILQARCKSSGLSFRISDKGAYSDRSVTIFGGLEPLANFLRDDIVSPILDAFMIHHETGRKLKDGQRRYLTVQDMQEAVIAKVVGSSKGLRKARREKLEEGVTSTVSDLIRKGILQPGALFHCPHCGDLEWYHASQFAEHYTCRRCLIESSCGPSPEWRYHLHESIFLGYWNNMRAPILALDVLRSQARTSFASMPEIRFERKSGARQEADIVACSDGDLVIGEAKITSHVNQNQIAGYEELCRELKAAKIVFALSERATTPCKKRLCDACPSADEAFSHGNPDDESNWGTRERIKVLRKRLAPLGVRVNTYCPQVLETGELPYLSFVDG